MESQILHGLNNIYQLDGWVWQPPFLIQSNVKGCSLTTTSSAWVRCACLVAQSCLTLRDPMDCNLPGPSVCGILQATILEWVAISFSREFSWLNWPGIKPRSPTLQADCLPSQPPPYEPDSQGLIQILLTIVLESWNLVCFSFSFIYSPKTISKLQKQKISFNKTLFW